MISRSAVTTPPARQIAFLDIEASGLGPDSFPIEIGWATLDGQSGSWLIKAADDWSMDAWDEAAEAVHGISRSELDHGNSAWAVAKALNALLGAGNMMVLSDAPAMDGFWLDRLFDQTAALRSFQLTDFATTFRATFADIDPDSLLTDHAPRHRAEADALWLRDLWAIASKPPRNRSPS